MLNNLQVNNQSTTISFNGKQIHILKYLDVRAKKTLIDLVIEKSLDNGIYNDIILDAMLKVCAAYLYTDIDFTDEDKADSLTTYDILNSNGFFDLMIETIGNDEWDELESYLYDVLYSHKDNEKSLVRYVNKLLGDLPANINALQTVMKDFKPEEMQAVVDFANAANGNRNFQTNEPIG